MPDLPDRFLRAWATLRWFKTEIASYRCRQAAIKKEMFCTHADFNADSIIMFMVYGTMDHGPENYEYHYDIHSIMVYQWYECHYESSLTQHMT